MADSETQQVDVKKLVTEAIIADALEDTSARLVALSKRMAKFERKTESIIEDASARLVALSKRMAELERKAMLTTVGVLTSQTPATKQKNPKRVAAAKAIAERTRQAREAQKSTLAEVNVIIANNQLKQPEPPAVAPPAADALPAEPSKNVLTTTQSSRDSDGYPLAGQDEVDNAKQSSAISK